MKWRILGFGLLIAAVVTEMRKAPADRQGYGRVAGVVPYDFRAPTFERLRRSMWNPNDDRLFTPNAFGVGWSPNFAQFAELWRAAKNQPM